MKKSIFLLSTFMSIVSLNFILSASSNNDRQSIRQKFDENLSEMRFLGSLVKNEYHAAADYLMSHIGSGPIMTLTPDILEVLMKFGMCDNHGILTTEVEIALRSIAYDAMKVNAHEYY